MSGGEQRNGTPAARLAPVAAYARAGWTRTAAWWRGLEVERRARIAAAVTAREAAAVSRAAAAQARAAVAAAGPALARLRAAEPAAAARPLPDPELAAMLARDGLAEGETAQADPPRPKRPARPAPLFGDLPEQPAPVRLPPAEAMQPLSPDDGVAGQGRIGMREWWRALPDRERMTMTALGGVLAGALLVAGIGQAADPERARIEGIVRDYLLTHPEILPEAMARLKERGTAKAVGTQRKALETPFAGAWAGDPDGDVTLVEFFDYACGYCRQSVADVDRLLAEDKKLRVVFRELPVLGAASDAAALVSLSAAKQGRFLDFHRALYAAGRPTPANVAAARRTAGLDAARVNADVQAGDTRAEVETNLALAQALEVGGTPTFVVGDAVLGGAVGYAALKAAIATARARR